jgi:hypothetical protein
MDGQQVSGIADGHDVFARERVVAPRVGVGSNESCRSWSLGISVGTAIFDNSVEMSRTM